ncbi:hypothetical protein, partial [Streptomyces sp. IBSBF 2390]|uniref:hypothetical protein n=1 Tax=Streptomyces sp. IBSBF 2390 TaxID=2903533 RepID=UPI002FDBA1D7
WRTFCEGIESSNEASRFRKILTKEQAVPSFIKKQDGTWSETAEDILGTLMDVHFPESQNEVNRNELSTDYIPMGDKVEEIVTVEKIRWVIKSVDPYKSPGQDGIFPAMLQKLEDNIIPRLMDIFRLSLKLGSVRIYTKILEGSKSSIHPEAR